MYPSYELPSHVPTQSLFDTKIGMMQTFSTATPLRLTEYVWKALK